MLDTERGALQQMVERLVELARAHDVPAESIAAALGDHVEAHDTEPGRLKAVLDQLLEEARSDDVILSRDRVADLFDMTPQSVSWHVKQGNLQGVKVRVGGRLRLGITLSSVCDYFGITPDYQAKLSALLPRRSGGKYERVFWEAAGPSGERIVRINWPETPATAKVLGTGVVRKVIT